MTRTIKGLLAMTLVFPVVYLSVCHFPILCMWVAVLGVVFGVLGMMLQYITARSIKTNNEARWAYIGE